MLRIPTIPMILCAALLLSPIPGGSGEAAIGRHGLSAHYHCTVKIHRIHGKRKRITVCHAGRLQTSRRVSAPSPTATIAATRTPAPTATATPTTSPTPTSTPTPRTSPTPSPPTYYLALGDSLAYGYQPNGDYGHGYADDIFGALRGTAVTQLVNYGCPGETSGTFIAGGCPDPGYRKDPYSGSQLAAAVNFLRSHPGQVALVTLNIGVNDLGAAVSNCSSQSNASAVLQSDEQNLSLIYGSLRSAMTGGAIVAMLEYDPWAYPCGDASTPHQLVVQLDGLIRQEAAQHDIRLADVFTAFGDSQVPNPHVCDYRWDCSVFHDDHPTDLGYSVIAQTFRVAAGLG